MFTEVITDRKRAEEEIGSSRNGWRRRTYICEQSVEGTSLWRATGQTQAIQNVLRQISSR